MGIEVEEEVLVYGLRYCLGRHTYAVSVMCWAIHDNLDKLSIRALFVIGRDILEFLDRVRVSDIRKDIEEVDNISWARLLSSVVSLLPDQFREMYPYWKDVVDYFRKDCKSAVIVHN